MAELKSGSYQHKRELDRILSENDEQVSDPYARLMLPFLQTVSEELSRLSDQVQKTERIYADVLRYYGEGSDPRRRNFPAQQTLRTEDFFGIFREFVVSYRKAQKDNALIREQRQIETKRRALAEEQEKQRQLARQRKETASPDDGQLLESLLGHLRQTGGPTGRHRRKARRHPSAGRSLTSISGETARDVAIPPMPDISPVFNMDETLLAPVGPAGATADGGLQPLTSGAETVNRHSTSTLAETLLAQLQGDSAPHHSQTATEEEDALRMTRRRGRPRQKRAFAATPEDDARPEVLNEVQDEEIASSPASPPAPVKAGEGELVLPSPSSPQLAQSNSNNTFSSAKSVLDPPATGEESRSSPPTVAISSPPPDAE